MCHLVRADEAVTGEVQMLELGVVEEVINHFICEDNLKTILSHLEFFQLRVVVEQGLVPRANLQT